MKLTSCAFEELAHLVAEREAAHAHVVERHALLGQQVHRLDARRMAPADGDDAHRRAGLVSE